MTREELQKIFESEFDWNNWKKVMNFVFPEFKFNLVQTDLTRDTKAHKKSAGYIKEHGTTQLASPEMLTLCEILVNDNVRLDRNIKSVRSLVADLAVPNYQTVIAVFHNADNTKWRFTLVVKEFTGANKVFDKKPDSYTYVFGIGEKGRTASERFLKLAGNPNKTLKDLEEAFSVEALSKKFFKEYKDIYQQFVEDIIKNPSRLALFKETSKEKQEKSARDFVKKMMGRLVFLYFLQKKGWLGCKTKWQGGDEAFMKTFVEKAKLNDLFYHHYLEPLFFDTLNDKRTKQDEDCIIQKTNFGKVPYLNGGLFEKDDNHPKGLTLKWEIFEAFFETLNNYNFTIIEDDPEFKEVAVDPEMLGHIFENLLEDNKDKGAYYTPKEIVHYMCQESLYEYLKTYLEQNKHWPKSESDVQKLEKDLQRFVKQKLASGIIDYDKPLAKALKEVKICDPAIGSGAFPMGLLNEIYHCVHKLHDESPDKVGDVWGIGKVWQGNKVKLNIIQNSIYGVDIEKGAVDIARLRFWLSLIVDEPEPTPLPNLDYKIMQGNSLLESFEGIDLKFDRKKYVKPIEKAKDLFGNIADKDKQISIAEAMATSNFDLVKMERDYFGTQNPEQKEIIRKQITDFEKKFIKDQIAERERVVTETIHTLSRKLNANRYETANKKKNDEKLMKACEEELLLVEQAKLNAQKIKEGNKPYFLWNLYFLNVIDDGGFDIIIANPPYINIELLSEDFKRYIFSNYSFSKGRTDIYISFLEKSYSELLKENGALNFIIPFAFTNQNYGEPIRRFFIENSYINQIVDLTQFYVFDNATVKNIIFNLVKQSPKKTDLTKIVSAKSLNDFKTNSLQIKFKDQQFYLTLDNYRFETKDVEELISIKEKVLAASIPLENICLVAYGARLNSKIEKEKFKDFYIHDKPKRGLKPFIEGRDIERYFHRSSGYLDYRPEEHYNSMFKELFESEKLMFINVVSEKLRFTYDDENLYNSHTVINVVKASDLIESDHISARRLVKNADLKLSKKISLKFILGIVNSSLLNWYFKNFLSEGLHFYPDDAKKFPILKSIENQNLVVSMVNKVLSKKAKGEDTEGLEREIDLLVCRLYGLSYSEMMVVNPGWDIDEKEYTSIKLIKHE